MYLFWVYSARLPPRKNKLRFVCVCVYIIRDRRQISEHRETMRIHTGGFIEIFVGKVHGNIMLMNRITCRFLGDFFFFVFSILFICLPKWPRMFNNRHRSRRCMCVPIYVYVCMCMYKTRAFLAIRH